MIDLRSDTQTKPSQAMREAMASAEVGDEQEREDPTVLELERRVAELLGHEEAVYLPTAMMANEIALAILGERGTQLVVERTAHIMASELGGAAFFAGLQTRGLAGHLGRRSPELMDRARIEKHRFGGAMRQAGIVAAAGLYALEHNVDRLAEDHARARTLAEAWVAGGVPVDLERVQSNFVQIDVAALGLGEDEACELLELQGVGLSRTMRPGVLRAVTHLDLTDDDIAQAAKIVPDVLSARVGV